MRLIESVTIQHGNPWEPELDGLFLDRNGGVMFCFMEGWSVVAQSEDGSKEVWYTAPEGERLELPYHWTGAAKGAAPMLRTWWPSNTEIYYFEDYTISHTSQWSYVCKKAKETVWKFKGYAWRYTTIERFGENIYFGTAGQGGYFYLLNLHNGEALLKLKTGGTVNIYARRENRLYLLQQEKKAYLVCIDLSDGTILERLELPGKAHQDSAIRLIGDTIHCVTFTYKGGPVKEALWNRVEV
ncbi:MAG: hypothetical protein J6I89_04765 [Oscillospiraceae bacterium]|nr:hypothetical protein [Oscillospiraceae bacterium]